MCCNMRARRFSLSLSFPLSLCKKVLKSHSFFPWTSLYLGCHQKVPFTLLESLPCLLVFLTDLPGVESLPDSVKLTTKKNHHRRNSTRGSWCYSPGCWDSGLCLPIPALVFLPQEWVGRLGRKGWGAQARVIMGYKGQAASAGPGSFQKGLHPILLQ